MNERLSELSAISTLYILTPGITAEEDEEVVTEEIMLHNNRRRLSAIDRATKHVN